MRETPRAILIFKRVYITAVLLTALCWLFTDSNGNSPTRLASHVAGAASLGR